MTVILNMKNVKGYFKTFEIIPLREAVGWFSSKFIR